jgi:hypothetical protein
VTLDTSWSRPFLDAFLEHRTVREACRQVGISKDTVYRARKADEHFAAAFGDAEEQIADEAEDELARLAFGGEGTNSQIRALELILKARRPERYSERHRLEHSGAIANGQAEDMSEMTDEDLSGIVAEAERATDAAVGE